jgi:hypothetical protein
VVPTNTFEPESEISGSLSEVEGQQLSWESTVELEAKEIVISSASTVA